MKMKCFHYLQNLTLIVLIDDVEISDDSDEKKYDQENSDKQNYSEQ